MALKLVAVDLTAEQTADGFSYVESYHVTGLTGASDQIKMDAALSEAGLPAIGDAHPVESDSVVTSIRARIIGPDYAEVMVRYEVPRSEDDNPKLDTTGVVRFFGSLVGETATEDKDGAFLAVSWEGTVADIFPDQPPTQFLPIINQPFEAEIFRPTFGFELTLRETSVATVKALALTHVGRVNDATWSGLAARTVLLNGIDLEELTPAELRVRYQFEYKPATWDFVKFIRVYGRIPSNVSPSNGTATVQLFDTADFSLLPVSL